MQARLYILIIFLSALLFSKVNILWADAVADREATHTFLQQIEKQRATDAAGALQATQQFKQQHASMDPIRLSEMDNTIAHIYFYDLKDPAKAFAVLESGMARSPKSAAYLPLLTVKFRFLGQANRKPEAIALVKANLPKYIEGDQYFLKNLLASYVPMVSIAGKPEDVTSVLLPALGAHPDIIDNERVGKNLVRYLLKEPGHEEEALSYGKLYWMVCDFDASLLNPATALLQKAWMAKDMSAAQGAAFLNAQQDASAPNPLQQVKLPALDAAKIQSALKALSKAPKYNHTRITLLLLQGQYGDAMLVARRQLLADPTGSANQSAMEIARIFKAADLNLVHANAFLQHFKTGQGANPMDDFFKEHPASTTTAPGVAADKATTH